MTEFEQRRQAVADRLSEHKVDALWVSKAPNVRYLTGYAGSNGLVLITPCESHFFTDPRYGTEARATISGTVHIAKVPLQKEALAVVKRKKLKKIGFDPGQMSVSVHKELTEGLPLGSSLESVTGVVEELRAVKSPSEIDKIRRSILLNSEAFARTVRRVRSGWREREIAAELDFQMRKLGAEKTAFETIVASGPNSALPHAHPTDRKTVENELLLIDMGAMLDGYASDMTRMLQFGEVEPKAKKLYKAVLEAQLAAIDAVRPGVPVKKVDAVARGVLTKLGCEKEFVHSTGHGLGLEIHEGPSLRKKEKGKLKAGMAITIEPGAYIEGFAGVRIEDTILVTETGCEVLTPTTKELITLY